MDAEFGSNCSFWVRLYSSVVLLLQRQPASSVLLIYNAHLYYVVFPFARAATSQPPFVTDKSLVGLRGHDLVSSISIAGKWLSPVHAVFNTTVTWTPDPLHTVEHSLCPHSAVFLDTAVIIMPVTLSASLHAVSHSPCRHPACPCSCPLFRSSSSGCRVGQDVLLFGVPAPQRPPFPHWFPSDERPTCIWSCFRMLLPPPSPCPPDLVVLRMLWPKVERCSWKQLNGWRGIVGIVHLPAIRNKVRYWIQFTSDSSLGPENSAWELLWTSPRSLQGVSRVELLLSKLIFRPWLCKELGT